MRELTALEEEHSATKRNLARAEELVAPSRLAAQEARQQHEEGTERLATVEEEWKTTERELRIEAEVVGKECEELMEERVGTAADIDKSDLALYNSLLPRKSGIAVARVERGICQGCRIKLPMREMSRLKSSDRLVVCSSCGRILLGS
jgi:predicted  nucleic acid-binding Zn-ribbon protein